MIWLVSGGDGADFKQVAKADFSWQHDMRVYNKTDIGLVLSLFNNANSPTERQFETTGVSLAIDSSEKTVTGLRSLAYPNGPIHIFLQGSYQLLGETGSHIFMDYGSIAKVKEFDGDGNVVFGAQSGDDESLGSYRSYHCQWSATPFWKPSVSTNNTTPAATVCISCNWAIEYESRIVYAASSATSTNTTNIAPVKHTGFETKVDLTNPPTRFVQVVVRKGSDTVGTSKIFRF